MDLIAKLPVVAATIYNNLYRDGATPCAIDPDKDWSYNFTEMVGYKDEMFTELMRLYLTIHRLVPILFWSTLYSLKHQIHLVNT